MVEPETLIRWHRKEFRLFGAASPAVAHDLRVDGSWPTATEGRRPSNASPHGLIKPD